MNDNFYRDFEEKHRGTRETIISRLRAYLPFVEPLSRIEMSAPTIDLGCGRGEWLELMAEIGFSPFGVDLDEGMLQACKDKGLPAEKGDAVVFLGNLPSESQVLITAFHVVEHLSFEQLRSVVSEAHRVLMPGGLLIMETPNPENIVVATQNFYLDPTHQRPIPWQLLSFIPEYYGFVRVKTIRLQEDKHLLQKIPISFQDVISGVSPDYAVIAQKDATDEIIHLLDQAFVGDYGLSLDAIAEQYHRQTISNVQGAEKISKEAMIFAQQAVTKAHQAETKAQQAETKAQQSETKAQRAETKAQQSETKAQRAETVAQQTEHALNLIYSSHSWRITAPLRLAGGVIRHPIVSLRKFANFTLWYLIEKFRRPLAHVMRWVLRRHRLAGRLNRWLMRFPPLHQQLLDVASAAGVLHRMPYPVTYQVATAPIPRGNTEGCYLRAWYGEKECEITVDEALEAIREDVKRFRGGA